MWTEEFRLWDQASLQHILNTSKNFNDSLSNFNIMLLAKSVNDNQHKVMHIWRVAYDAEAQNSCHWNIPAFR